MNVAPVTVALSHIGKVIANLTKTSLGTSVHEIIEVSYVCLTNPVKCVPSVISSCDYLFDELVPCYLLWNLLRRSEYDFFSMFIKHPSGFT